ncbi:hypothetical protein BDV37DRAFT_278001 [Aspergillus pseudonomiae]|uniref:Integral membrane protein n=1 Tax=Aspergillus pseudonomiae TaxID=1506151 RepID=A0A5N7DT74_9EURO|nr:uncharacterized protein BDV37DRAFT_278001 [Aspergillus pseudonomiae]KAE8409661.1 hypothetical protein BDV37DRAFT_278001 [Aspergillus pseudonomiae]
MTSPAEQVLLFGGIIDPELVSGLALFGYADLTVGSAIIFATITIFAYIASDWKVLSSWISALLTAVVRPIRAVVLGISWLLMQLAAVRPLADIFTTLRTLEDAVKSRIIENRLSRLVSAVVDWYFPFNHPLATVCRLSLSFICGTTVMYDLLLPAAWHVSGLVMAVSSSEEELSYHCFDVFGRLEQGRLNRREWLEVAFCCGQETGLELREIHHLYVIAFVTTSVSCAILAVLSWYALAKAVSSRRADKLQPAALRVDHIGHETQLRGTPPTPREIDLWNIIDQCEGVITKQKGLLIARTEELKVVKQRMEGSWALVKKLSAQPDPIEEVRPRETTVIVELRQELAVKEGQLSNTQGKLRQLEEQLAREREQAEADFLSEHQSLRAELQAWNDQLVTLEQRLAAAEAREQQSRGHTDTERQNLVVYNNDLIAQNQELMAQCQAFQAEHDRLHLQFRDSSVTIQERDAALRRVMLLEAELETNQSSADSVARHAQVPLTRAHEAEVALRQSMSNLQHTCDLTLAQERAAADQAQKRASDLTAEVNDLQGKIGMAMREAQRSQEQAAAAERTIQILEHRLSRWEASRSSQEIPKRPTQDVGSISTALAQSQVTVSQQQTEINNLRRQLDKDNQGVMCTSEQVAQEGVQKLREALNNEKRARTEDNIRWGKKTRELEDECQKLRISLSNTAAASTAASTAVRRQGNRRLPTIP